MRTLIEIFQEIISSPGKVSRYNTAYIFEPRTAASFPFPEEIMSQFVDNFKLTIEKYSFVSVKPIEGWQYEKDQSLLLFLHDYYKGTADDVFAKAVLGAMVLLLEQNPGSLFHEFMALHQVRHALNFDKTYNATNRNKIINREIDVFRVIKEIHQQLAVNNIQPALKLIKENSIENPTLDQCKNALLIIECYRLAQESYKDNAFSMIDHEAKNCKFLIALDAIPEFDEHHETIDTMVSVINVTPDKIGNDTSIQSLILKEIPGVALSQPKTLGPLWTDFFKKIYDYDNQGSLVNRITYFSTQMLGESIFWFEALAAAGADQGSPEDILYENYSTLYFLLQRKELLPLGAQSPRRTVIESSSPSVTDAGHQLLSPSPANIVIPLDVAMPVDEFALPSIPPSEISEPLAADEPSVADESHVVGEPAASDDQAMNEILFEDNVSELGVEEQNSIDPYDVENSQPDASITELFLANYSEFANKFISLVKEYYSLGSNEDSTLFEKRKEIFRSLIKKTLKLSENAQENGVNIIAPEAIKNLKEENNKKLVNLDDAAIFRNLYTVLHALLFANLELGADKKKASQYINYAGATLLQLRQMDKNISQYFFEKIIRSYLKLLNENGGKPSPVSLSLLKMLTHKVPRTNQVNDFFWKSVYEKSRKSDIEQQRCYQILCAQALWKLRHHQKEDSVSLEEKWLLAKTIFSLGNTDNTPFYSAIQLLAVTDIENSNSVIAVNTQEAQEKETIYCAALVRRNKSAFIIEKSSIKNDRQSERLELERKDLVVNMPSSLSKAWDDSASVATAGSNYTKQSHVSSMSRSMISRLSMGSSQSKHGSEVTGEIAEENWNAVFKEKGQFTHYYIEFILKNFDNFFQEDSQRSENEKIELLKKVFQQLRPEISKKGLLSTTLSTFGASNTAIDIPPENFNCLQHCLGERADSLLVPPFALAFYYFDQIQQLNTDGNEHRFKSYEIDFMIENYKYLCFYKDQLCENPTLKTHNFIPDALDLIYPSWNKKLAALERKQIPSNGKALSEYTKAINDQRRYLSINGKFLASLDTPLGGKNNDETIPKRFKALYAALKNRLDVKTAASVKR